MAAIAAYRAGSPTTRGANAVAVINAVIGFVLDLRLADPAGFVTPALTRVRGDEPVTLRVAFKPTSSILTPQPTINRDGEATELFTKGRHDPCVGIRATPIAEAMLALVLMDQALRHRAQCGDVGAMAPRIPGSLDG